MIQNLYSDIIVTFDITVISHNFSVNVANFVLNFVVKSILKFTSRFVNKASDWSLNKNKPIRGFVYKLACEFQYKLLNFTTKFGTSSQHSRKSHVKSTVIVKLP